MIPRPIITVEMEETLKKDLEAKQARRDWSPEQVEAWVRADVMRTFLTGALTTEDEHLWPSEMLEAAVRCGSFVAAKDAIYNGASFDRTVYSEFTPLGGLRNLTILELAISLYDLAMVKCLLQQGFLDCCNQYSADGALVGRLKTFNLGNIIWNVIVCLPAYKEKFEILKLLLQNCNINTEKFIMAAEAEAEAPDTELLGLIIQECASRIDRMRMNLPKEYLDCLIICMQAGADFAKLAKLFRLQAYSEEREKQLTIIMQTENIFRNSKLYGMALANIRTSQGAKLAVPDVLLEKIAEYLCPNKFYAKNALMYKRHLEKRIDSQHQNKDKQTSGASAERVAKPDFQYGF